MPVAGRLDGQRGQQLRFRAALRALSEAEVEDLAAFLRRVTEGVASALQVERASVWLLADDRRALICRDLHLRSIASHRSGDRLTKVDAPGYFGTIGECELLVADDAQAHPALQDLVGGYLAPLGVRSMLDVPVRRGSCLKGVLCVEHTGPLRRWTDAEQSFALAVAAMVAMALEHEKRRRAEAAITDINLHLQERVQQRTRDLRDSEERFRGIFQQSSTMVILTSMGQERVTELNPAALAATAFDWSDAIGRTLGELGLAIDPVAWEGSALAPPHPAGSKPLQAHLRRADGTRRTLLGSVTALAVGTQMHWLYCLQDITEREQAREALAALTTELERRVDERTAALEHAKLEAERANATKSRFLSNISHELRTPLNAIIGFAELLLADGVPGFADERQGHAAQIHGAGRHLLTLINDILDLSRVEAGRMMLEQRPVSPAEQVAECRRLLEPLAQARGLSWDDRTGAQRHLLAFADPVRLKQVLVNLLSNAIKFNRPGGTVCVALQADGHGVRIDVEDEGNGLLPEQCELLFRHFERLDADRAAVEGSGIGLSLSRQLVEAMGGRIGVRSSPGHGCTFWFWLPRPFAAVPDLTNLPAVVQQPPPDMEPPRARRTLLYIDDNPVNLILMEAMLARIPALQMIAAAMPQMGIEIACSQHPDIIFLDIHLPGMDGFEVLRRLRADPRTASIPVVATTADSASAEHFEAAGFAAHLGKPMSLEQLQAVLQRLA